jgi:phosphopentomutase
MKRVFLIVLDSVGIGEMPDAKEYGDEGSNTLKSVATSKSYSMPNMERLGLYHIDGLTDMSDARLTPQATYARMSEASKGKDTTIGHWEISGIISEKPLPTFSDGFPLELLSEFEKRTSHRVICNKSYSGTEVIKDYGKEHIETGALIVYTSADSVFQIAAHEDIVPLEELYRFCEIAREICQGEAFGVGRVIARPFTGTYPELQRTQNRHDYSLIPPKTTMLNQLKDNGFEVIAVGKINDIFASSGVTSMVRTKDNAAGIEETIKYTKTEFEGLCFINLVDFDMLYGHRNDVEGYAKALSYFDEKLPLILEGLQEEDILMITADHGCDPTTPSTDHSREYTPLIVYGKQLKSNCNLNTRNCFADIGASIVDYFGIKKEIAGVSFLAEIMK